jgi:hypothetical protein
MDSLDSVVNDQMNAMRSFAIVAARKEAYMSANEQASPSALDQWLAVGGAWPGRRTPGVPAPVTPPPDAGLRAQGIATMFVPHGFLEFRRAAALVPDCDDDWGSDDPKGERLGSALASGDLVSHGIVVGAVWRGDVEGLGDIRELRPEAWRRPGAREAVLGAEATGQLLQDDFIMRPIIECSAFYAWQRAEFEKPMQTLGNRASSVTAMTGLPCGVHAIPTGFVAFDQIHVVAHASAEEGLIDRDLLPLLAPPDTDCLTEALVSGLLPAFGISKRTGEIVHLPSSTWRMDVGGCLQSLWAIRGDDVVAGADGDPCLPVLTRADLARALKATTIPPDPPELPSGWQPAAPIQATPISMNPSDALGSWMLGYAEGFKALGRLVKRDEAVHAAMGSRHCTSRQAEAAYAALPYPDLRNPPRTQAA